MISSKGRSEGEVLAGIVAYLSCRGDIVAWRNNTGGFAPRPGQWMQFGHKGSADLLCVWAPSGRFVGIETKREKGGTLSAAQKEWGEDLERFGGLYIVARSVDEVRRALGEPKTRVAVAGFPRVIHR